MNSVRTDETPDGAWAPILDLSGRPVELVDLADDGPVGRCLRRVVESLDDPTAVMSAFSSFASDH
jgi:hypothetical protein